ncbi:hypothetical protein BDV98DRAFT_158629 [Pterulicium gracile]|uniref:Uncharacterized protein n=1 Tax=Pterulicium gracile TaxID=1884261 RepID=A0A5C3QXI9_9AGAR|nr:hypothetical protein BDV98DRAFT_158629 [Pterula gracilis]
MTHRVTFRVIHRLKPTSRIKAWRLSNNAQDTFCNLPFSTSRILGQPQILFFESILARSSGSCNLTRRRPLLGIHERPPLPDTRKTAAFTSSHTAIRHQCYYTLASTKLRPAGLFMEPRILAEETGIIYYFSDVIDLTSILLKFVYQCQSRGASRFSGMYRRGNFAHGDSCRDDVRVPRPDRTTVRDHRVHGEGRNVFEPHLGTGCCEYSPQGRRMRTFVRNVVILRSRRTWVSG